METADHPSSAAPGTGRDWTVPRVGLTGGVASGKSLVADQFRALGVPVLDTDVLARSVVEPGTPALAEVTATFGPGVLGPDGRLDRTRLRELVFADPDRRRRRRLRRLEAILHPRILAALEAEARAAAGPYQVLVVPLLFESGFDARVDRVLVVDCPESLQRERLARRDGASPALVEGMLAAQLDRDARLARARALPHDVLDNGGDRESTRRQVTELHRRYLALFADPASGRQLSRFDPEPAAGAE
jgi:dephospho-CoA kinase